MSDVPCGVNDCKYLCSSNVLTVPVTQPGVSWEGARSFLSPLRQECGLAGPGSVHVSWSLSQEDAGGVCIKRDLRRDTR